MRPVVYVAGPYSGADHDEHQRNIDHAEEIAGDLWKRGFAVICPHSNTAFYQEKFPEVSYEDYMDGDFSMIARCDALILMPNWYCSLGAKREKQFADANGIPVYQYPDLPEKLGFDLARIIGVVEPEHVR